VVPDEFFNRKFGENGPETKEQADAV